MKTGKDEKPAEDKSEDSREWFMGFKERSYLYNIKVQGEVARTVLEARASHQDLR